MSVYDTVTFAPGLLPPTTPEFATRIGQRFQTQGLAFHPQGDCYQILEDGRLIRGGPLIREGDPLIFEGEEIAYHGDFEVYTATRIGRPGFTSLLLTVRFTHGCLESIKPLPPCPSAPES